MRRSNRNRPLKTALQILFYLEDHRFGATVEDLMEETGYSRRAIYRYLEVFRDVGIKLVAMGHLGRGPKRRWRLENRKKYLVLRGIL